MRNCDDLPTLRRHAHPRKVSRNTAVYAYERLTSERLPETDTRREHARIVPLQALAGEPDV
jgi:DNA-binding transcriptional regulator YhcF (GntR family)